MISISIDGKAVQAEPGERLLDVINRLGLDLPQVCYHDQLGPIQTCDTCIVGVNGNLVRACATIVASGMRVATMAAPAVTARNEAFVSVARQDVRFN